MLVRAGATWLGVTNAAEGERVRGALANAGFDADILVMSGFLPGDVPAMLRHKLTPVVWTAQQVAWLSDLGASKIHLEVDTGMGRQGVRPGADLVGLLSAIAGTDLSVNGVFTHFCSSEIAHSAMTYNQQRRFEGVIAQVRASGLRPAWVHAGNTSTVDNPAQTAPWLRDLAATVGARAMVRSGLALYGYCLEVEGDAAPQVAPALQPVMAWKAPVLSIRALAPGETIGYNTLFTAEYAMRIALLPVGYADGLRRELSSSNIAGSERRGGWVMLHGQRAPILGRVSMNLTVADITHIPGVGAGDEALLLGDGITAHDHARLAETIPYEILCGIKPSE
jgi:alanine racemase